MHLLFSWSAVLSWLIFFADLALIAWLVIQAYRDADTLDRYVLYPHFPVAQVPGADMQHLIGMRFH